ncbi:hypothetical protein AGOR_G00233490 [Albula goreensis]|uniref:Uncharacterized protein n=1 Tax=Albula goreensis TaxID=1534307 RepID=A0A8T3CKJ2_9TELE|nr:hypothetical protein AGOR_G00233490 [Albula goreensis]
MKERSEHKASPMKYTVDIILKSESRHPFSPEPSMATKGTAFTVAMDLGQIGAVPFLLLLIQVHHAVSAPAVPDQDTWLTGFEPNLIDGQPVEPVCRIVPVTERPPTPTPVPKPTTTPPLVTVGRARPPNPAASPSVGNGWQPPIVPHNPHPGFMLVPFLVPNGRPWFVAGSVPAT